MGRVRTRRPICLSSRAGKRPQACYRCPQGQHHVSVILLFYVSRLIIYRKMSDGMFLSACREVSKDFPDVKYDEDLLDRVCLQVRKCPHLTPLLVGQLISRSLPTQDLSPTVSW